MKLNIVAQMKLAHRPRFKSPMKYNIFMDMQQCMRMKLIAYSHVKNLTVTCMFIHSQSVHAFFEYLPVNIPDLLYEKWFIMHEISSNILFLAFLRDLV